VEALKRWKKRQTCTEPGDHVFAGNGIPLNVEKLAEQSRAELERVGAAQLFERSASRQRIQSLRATSISSRWRPARPKRGDGPHWAHDFRHGTALPPQGAVV
jgi:hypothetical protein